MDQFASLGQQADLYVLVVAFMIGLGGSLHCAGMCGPLVAVTAKTKFQAGMYQMGRLLGYLFIGAVIGALGKVFVFNYSKPLNQVFSFLIAAFFIFLGLRFVVNKPFQFQMPKPLQKMWGLLKFSEKTAWTAWLTGFFSIFLPCGLLYAVVFGTLTFQHMFLGMAAMFAFWMGTLPAMVFAPIVVRKLLQPFASRRPQLTGFFLISLGLLTLLLRYQNTVDKCLFCH